MEDPLFISSLEIETIEIKGKCKKKKKKQNKATPSPNAPMPLAPLRTALRGNTCGQLWIVDNTPNKTIACLILYICLFVSVFQWKQGYTAYTGYVKKYSKEL